MKQLFSVAGAVILVIVIICVTVTANNWINRDKVHVPTPEEIFVKECAERGGNVISRVGWDNEIHIDEQKCEGTK